MNTKTKENIRRIDLAAIALVLYGHDIQPRREHHTVQIAADSKLYRFGENDEFHLLVDGGGGYQAIAHPATAAEVKRPKGHLSDFKVLDISTYIEAADSHGEDQGYESQASDMRKFLRAAWEIMTPAQRVKFASDSDVQETFNIATAGDGEEFEFLTN